MLIGAAPEGIRRFVVFSLQIVEELDDLLFLGAVSQDEEVEETANNSDEEHSESRPFDNLAAALFPFSVFSR